MVARAGEPLSADVTARPGSSDRIQSLDGYRAIAAIGVVLYHTAVITGFLGPNQPGAHLIDNAGNFGVAVFFLLSGFLLFRPFAISSLTGTPRPATAPFYIRRLLRIFPGYWLALIAWALVAAPVDRVPGTTIGKLFLIDPYDSRVRTWQVGLRVSWSLTIEVAFYVVLPIYAGVVARVAARSSNTKTRLRVHLIGLGIIYLLPLFYRSWQRSWDGAPVNSVNWLPAFTDWFALGMLLALASAWIGTGRQLPSRIRELARRTWACWTLAAASYLAIVLLKGQELHFDRQETVGQMSWRFFFQGLAALFFLLPATIGNADGVAMRALRSRPSVWLGTISYGIYLWHLVVALWIRTLADQSTARERFVVLTVMALAITIPVAAISYFAFERPMTELYVRRKAVHSNREPVIPAVIPAVIPVVIPDDFPADFLTAPEEHQLHARS